MKNQINLDALTDIVIPFAIVFFVFGFMIIIYQFLTSEKSIIRNIYSFNKSDSRTASALVSGIIASLFLIFSGNYFLFPLLLVIIIIILSLLRRHYLNVVRSNKELRVALKQLVITNRKSNWEKVDYILKEKINENVIRTYNDLINNYNQIN